MEEINENTVKVTGKTSGTIIKRGLGWVFCVVFMVLLLVMLGFEALYYKVKAEKAEIQTLYCKAEIEKDEFQLSHHKIEVERNKARSELKDLREKPPPPCQPMPTFVPSDQVLVELRIEQLQPKLDPAIRVKIANAIIKNCRKNNLPPSLVVHLIYRETTAKARFSQLSKSGADAKGLMQVRDQVHMDEIPELAKLKPHEIYHIEPNIKYGCQILKKYIDSSETLDQALKKYVGGNPKSYISDIYRLMAEFEFSTFKVLHARSAERNSDKQLNVDNN